MPPARSSCPCHPHIVRAHFHFSQKPSRPPPPASGPSRATNLFECASKAVGITGRLCYILDDFNDRPGGQKS